MRFSLSSAKEIQQEMVEPVDDGKVSQVSSTTFKICRLDLILHCSELKTY